MQNRYDLMVYAGSFSRTMSMYAENPAEAERKAAQQVTREIRAAGIYAAEVRAEVIDDNPDGPEWLRKLLDDAGL